MCSLQDCSAFVLVWCAHSRIVLHLFLYDVLTPGLFNICSCMMCSLQDCSTFVLVWCAHSRIVLHLFLYDLLAPGLFNICSCMVCSLQDCSTFVLVWCAHSRIVLHLCSWMFYHCVCKVGFLTTTVVQLLVCSTQMPYIFCYTVTAWVVLEKSIKWKKIK